MKDLQQLYLTPNKSPKKVASVKVKKTNTCQFSNRTKKDSSFELIPQFMRKE